MAAVVGSILGVVINQLWNPIKQQLGYPLTIRKNIEDLKEAMKELQDKRDEIKKEIDDAKRRLMDPTHRIQGWLERVCKVESKVETIVKQYDERRRCFGRCSPNLNCWSNYGISRRAEKQLEKVKKELGDAPAVTTTEIPLESLPEVPVPDGVQGMESSLKEALAFVRGDGKEGMLGIWGMGGVGKTTLLRKIYDSSIGDPAFDIDHVVFIVASRECTVAKVQKDIASSLKLLTRDGEWAQAAVIFNFLKDKSFLLLLDDLWRRLDLESVGIPQLGTAGDRRRKVVLTTRKLDVCGNMEARKKIKVDCLKEEDAWRLFEGKVGQDVIDSHPRIRNLAKRVVAECAGLPLALITIGRAMSAKRTPEEWEHAIHLLEKSRLLDISGTEDAIFPLLKFSYDNLESETMRQCFLCCSLWPEDYDISKDDLTRCWMGFGLIDEFGDIDEAYGMGYSIVGSLQAACMLEPVNEHWRQENTYVKMHDVIRDMALWIASDCGLNKSKWLVRAGSGLQEAPGEEEKWLAAQRVSLMRNKLQALSSDIVCPNLRVLMLQYSSNLPIHIFNTVANFCELTYLDLEFSGIESIPKEIGQLVKLQYLNVSSALIATLPEELGNLVNLKYLFLRENRKLRTIPPNLMLRLRRLRVLDLFLPFIPHNEDLPFLATLVTDLEGMNAHLKALGICVQTVSDIRRIAALSGTRTKSLCLHKLEGVTSLDILSANSLEYRNIQVSLKELAIGNCEIAEGDPRDQDPHLPRLESLHFRDLGRLQRIVWRQAGPYLREVEIIGCPTLEHATWVKDLPCLEYLRVVGCGRMKRIVVGEGEKVEAAEVEAAASVPTVPRLRGLELVVLAELESICDRPTYFPELRAIKVISCPNIRKISIQPRTTQSKIELICKEEWWENLEWRDGSDKSCFIPSFYITKRLIELVP